MINKKINIVILIVLQIMLLFIFFNNLSKPASGDEGFYLKEIEQLRNNGFYDTFKGGISYLYVSIAYLFTLLGINALIVTRSISFLSYLLIIYVSYKFLPGEKRIFVINQLSVLFLFYPNVIYGNSDNLMFFFIAFAYILYLSKKKLKRNDLYMFILLSLTFWVRKTAFIYCSPFILYLFFQYILKKEYKKLLFIPFIIFLILIPQIPSLLENGVLKFEDKEKYTGMDWSKMNYLTPIYRTKASLISYKRTSMEKVAEYESKHGEDSIPDGYLERLKFDPKFEIDNFFSHIPRILQLFLLMGGGFFIVSIVQIRTKEKIYIIKDDKGVPWLYYICTVIIPLAGLMFVIIRYIESRWVVPMVISLILSIDLNDEEKKIVTYGLIILSVYVMFKFINNLI